MEQKTRQKTKQKQLTAVSCLLLLLFNVERRNVCVCACVCVCVYLQVALDGKHPSQDELVVSMGTSKTTKHKRVNYKHFSS